MRFENYSETMPLTGETIDKISEKTENLLSMLKTETANILRIRLSMEEVLLRFMDKFGEGAEITVNIGKRIWQPYISIELAGEAYNPISQNKNEFEKWGNSLLAGIGLTPEYSYIHGSNIIMLKLKRPHKNPALPLIIALIAGMIAGISGKYLLSASIQADIVKTILKPINDVFFRLLNAAAGPVIFLSVVVAMCGMGNIASIGKNGRGMVLRFIVISVIITAATCIISIPFFKLNYLKNPFNDTEFSGVLDFILNIFPNDIFTPFVKGESPQLILMAIVLGNALLFVGDKGNKLMGIVEQANGIGLLVASWISRCTPYFVFLLLIHEIWVDSAYEFVGIWKPILIFLAVSAIIMTIYIAYVSIRKKVGFLKLVKKMYPSFLTALKTASVEYAFGENVICCEKKLGISKPMTSNAVPLGLIMFMPAGSAAVLTFTLYAADFSGISVSFIWYLFAVISTVILVVAEPPVAGVTILAYAAVFSQLGIPAEALTVAMVADIILSFFTSALNQAMLQAELVLQADKAGMLNIETLRN